MVALVGQLFPGTEVAADELLRLAHQFSQSSELARGLAKRSDSASAAPFRFAALHAIELALNAVLIHHGHGHHKVSALGHDLYRRAILAASHGFVLKPATLKQLDTLSRGRDYLAARYDASVTGAPSTAAMAAALREIIDKAARCVGTPARPVYTRVSLRRTRIGLSKGTAGA